MVLKKNLKNYGRHEVQCPHASFVSVIKTLVPMEKINKSCDGNGFRVLNVGPVPLVLQSITEHAG